MNVILYFFSFQVDQLCWKDTLFLEFALKKKNIASVTKASILNLLYQTHIFIWTHIQITYDTSGSVVCTATAGSTILMSCQDASGCVRGQDQQTRWIILPLHAPMSYCTCGRSTAPAVTTTTRCRWHPHAPATEHDSIPSTPTGTHTHTQIQ